VLHARRFSLAALAAGLVFSLSMVSMSTAAPPGPVPSIDVVRSRLGLTPEQEEKLAPLFQERLAQLQELRQRLEQAPSRQDKRALLREGKQQADAFNRKVEGVLDVRQKQEWQELRDETREKVKERIEEKRDSGS
jgi:hypothetical protein